MSQSIVHIFFPKSSIRLTMWSGLVTFINHAGLSLLFHAARCDSFVRAAQKNATKKKSR